jgi:Glycosyl transferase family 2
MKFSICCLIYKSIQWLNFVQQQVLKYTDLHDGEFFFVANDATAEVLSYLCNNPVPYYIHENSPVQKEEWFINNVYRGYNFGARQAQGDFLVFINSDMGLSPKWLDNLAKYYNGSNCITSRLVESGRLSSGRFGIERNFGTDCHDYHEADFLNYAAIIAKAQVEEGGLFMPLLVKKEDFHSIGGYPEGNIIPGSNIFSPLLAKPGEACISGDLVLTQKLTARRVKHYTAFDSIIYHFQRGESDSLI